MKLFIAVIRGCAIAIACYITFSMAVVGFIILVVGLFDYTSIPDNMYFKFSVQTYGKTYCVSVGAILFVIGIALLSKLRKCRLTRPHGESSNKSLNGSA